MTVRYITSAQSIQGQSSEKDGELVGAAFGALFFEEDTGKTYRKVSAQNPDSASWSLVDRGFRAEEVDEVNPLPVKITGPQGASHFDTDQEALSTTAEQVLAVNSVRRRVVIKNLDSAITVYIGKFNVSSSNGLELKPGESIALHTTASIHAIAASGTPSIAWLEEYD